MRQCPDVPLHDYRKAFCQSLGDAAGSWLADKEIRQFHVERNFAREAVHEHGDVRRHCPQLFRNRVVLPAEEDELNIAAGVIQRLRDFDNLIRTLASEQHQPRGHVGTQPETLARSITVRYCGS